MLSSDKIFGYIHYFHVLPGVTSLRYLCRNWQQYADCQHLHERMDAIEEEGENDDVYF